jgi:2-polyprenyl-3-methyl-5-hydroxy-6-metoxy-1,4-benzoquinol methylase
MALDDRARWDEKHAAEQTRQKPSSFLKEIFEGHSRALPKGRALDIATGKGRNAVFLAERGFQVVVGIDITRCPGHSAAGCQRKVPDHRLAGGGSRKDRTTYESL